MRGGFDFRFQSTMKDEAKQNMKHFGIRQVKTLILLDCNQINQVAYEKCVS